MIETEASKLSLYQNVSAEVIRKRKESANNHISVRYGTLFPTHGAVIKIFHPDSTRALLTNVNQISDYLNKLTASN